VKLGKRCHQISAGGKFLLRHDASGLRGVRLVGYPHPALADLGGGFVMFLRFIDLCTSLLRLLYFQPETALK
jgi:hypothetical protein